MDEICDVGCDVCNVTCDVQNLYGDWECDVLSAFFYRSISPLGSAFGFTINHVLIIIRRYFGVMK